MIARTYTATIQGIVPILVEVEASASLSDNSVITIVGLPDVAVKEARERLKPALLNSGSNPLNESVIVNLAPADIRKEGPSFDLPMAIAILGATFQIKSPLLQNHLFCGELALDGTLRPVRGALSMALCAKKHGKKGIFLPAENAREAAIVSGVNVYPAQNLAQIMAHLRNEQPITPVTCDFNSVFSNSSPELDFADVRGQESAKRALEVAAAGGHNILLIGPPGTGKSMLSKRIPSILPPLTFDEAIEVTQIHSVAGLLKPEEPLITTRPFRSPHHTASSAGLLGGGSYVPSTGEITLAHHGVLFLDELPEFKRSTLETLRQPLEEGIVSISRSSGTFIFPAQFMLVAAMNPTPDGKMPHQSRSNPLQIQNYLGRISGPLLDRIDLHIEVPAVSFQSISSRSANGETSAQIRERVIAARQIQTQRFAGSPHITCNARMGAKELKKFATLDDDCLNILKMAMDENHFSARAYDRIRKVARTIADLDHSEVICPQHVMEASQYRNLDRQIWDFRG
ncbi:MAG: YifB family Mg chelatase-like AAA ATPase [Verrucomicrobia bacterium]|nr:YifB family Mg chelatase-like AAA ATPase [Verrucomicrobiota bacterium]